MKVTVIATGFDYGLDDRAAAMPAYAADRRPAVRCRRCRRRARAAAPPAQPLAAPEEPERAVADVPFYRKVIAHVPRRRPGRLRPQLVERRRLRHPDGAEEADGLR